MISEDAGRRHIRQALAGRLDSDPLPHYTVDLPPLPLININKPGHFRAAAPKKAALRKAGKSAILRLEIPHMTRARIVCFVTRDVNGPKEKWDPANWYPSAKAVVDGFIDAKLLPDDSVKHVLGPDMRGVIGRKAGPHGLLSFRIIDLSDVESPGVDCDG